MKSKDFMFAMCIIGALLSIAYYPQLPDNMASHFNVYGRPDGWAAKPVFFFVYLASLVLFTLLFWAVPNMFKRIPPAWTNIPHKDYWLAPERIDIAQQMFSTAMHRFGIVTNAFLIFSFQCVILANITPSLVFPRGIMIGGLLFYFVFILIWLITLLKSYMKTQA